jgi:tungstate transport system ATP-binding protein
MVFQRPVLLRRSVFANVTYALALRGTRGPARKARADAALERFGLASLAGRSARVLSGGEQQRLALARAWAVEPEVLFLDEPTASLDPAATRAVEEALAAFRDAGTKIVMTTHDLGQARRLADEIVFLHRGRVIERSPAKTFFDAPASAEGRAFLKGELLW